MPEFSEALREFVRLFNEGRFWESHEALEGPWRANDSDFYRGLIIYASAFVHAQRGNRHGVLAQLRKAERYLGPYRPAYHGVDLEALFAHGKRWSAVVGEPTPRVPDDSDEERAARWARAVPFPRIRLDPKMLRGDEPELRPPGSPPDDRLNRSSPEYDE